MDKSVSNFSTKNDNERRNNHGSPSSFKDARVSHREEVKVSND